MTWNRIFNLLVQSIANLFYVLFVPFGFFTMCAGCHDESSAENLGYLEFRALYPYDNVVPSEARDISYRVDAGRDRHSIIARMSLSESEFEEFSTRRQKSLSNLGYTAVKNNGRLFAPGGGDGEQGSRDPLWWSPPQSYDPARHMISHFAKAQHDSVFGKKFQIWVYDKSTQLLWIMDVRL